MLRHPTGVSFFIRLFFSSITLSYVHITSTYINPFMTEAANQWTGFYMITEDRHERVNITQINQVI